MSPQYAVKTYRNEKFEMDYVVFGNGKKPLVIIPGLSIKPVTLTPAALATAYAGFAETHTVYFFARRKEIPDGYTIPDMAEDTAAALYGLGIENADLFGVSQGGIIVQYLAVFYPRLVRRLVIGSSFARPNPLFESILSKWAQLAEAGKRRELNHDIFDKIYSENFRKTYRNELAAMEDSGTPEELRYFAIQARACITFDLYDRLDGITCPTLVIGERRDSVVTGEASVEIAEKIGCDLFLYDGYAHAVYDEAPDYKQKLAAFFAAP